jgi:hypothetical protein
MSKEGAVYLLQDPRNSAVRYVGASKHPQERYKQHKSDRCHKEMRNWFRELAEHDLKPILNVVAWGELEQLDKLEEKWMKMMASQYDLLNRNMNISYNSSKVKACE